MWNTDNVSPKGHTAKLMLHYNRNNPAKIIDHDWVNYRHMEKVRQQKTLRYIIASVK